MSGKGSRQRPAAISQAELAENWELVFGESGVMCKPGFETSPTPVNPDALLHWQSDIGAPCS